MALNFTTGILPGDASPVDVRYRVGPNDFYTTLAGIPPGLVIRGLIVFDNTVTPPTSTSGRFLVYTGTDYTNVADDWTEIRTGDDPMPGGSFSLQLRTIQAADPANVRPATAVPDRGVLYTDESHYYVNVSGGEIMVVDANVSDQDAADAFFAGADWVRLGDGGRYQFAPSDTISWGEVDVDGVQGEFYGRVEDIATVPGVVLTMPEATDVVDDAESTITLTQAIANTIDVADRIISISAENPTTRLFFRRILGAGSDGTTYTQTAPNDGSGNVSVRLRLFGIVTNDNTVFVNPFGDVATAEGNPYRAIVANSSLTLADFYALVQANAGAANTYGVLRNVDFVETAWYHNEGFETQATAGLTSGQLGGGRVLGGLDIWNLDGMPELVNETAIVTAVLDTLDESYGSLPVHYNKGTNVLNITTLNTSIFRRGQVVGGGSASSAARWAGEVTEVRPVRTNEIRNFDPARTTPGLYFPAGESVVVEIFVFEGHREFFTNPGDPNGQWLQAIDPSTGNALADNVGYSAPAIRASGTPTIGTQIGRAFDHLRLIVLPSINPTQGQVLTWEENRNAFVPVDTEGTNIIDSRATPLGNNIDIPPGDVIIIRSGYIYKNNTSSTLTYAAGTNNPPAQLTRFPGGNIRYIPSGATGASVLANDIAYWANGGQAFHYIAVTGSTTPVTRAQVNSWCSFSTCNICAA